MVMLVKVVKVMQIVMATRGVLWRVWDKKVRKKRTVDHCSVRESFGAFLKFTFHYLDTD